MSAKKVKNYEVLQGIECISLDLDKEDFSTRIAFRLASWLKTLSGAGETFDEQRKKIVDKYTKKNAKGVAIHPKDANGKELTDRVELTDSDKYSEEMKALSNEEIEIQLLCTLSFKDFDNEDVKLKPSRLVPLLPFVEQEEQ